MAPVGFLHDYLSLQLMIRLYAPVAVAVVAIVSLTAWAGYYSDRLTSSSVTAAEFGKRFEQVPAKIGDWIGTDTPVDEAVLKQAGAVSHVSRRYVSPTFPDKHVDLWLVVGHSREICRHTPNICYPNQGFSQLGSTQEFTITPAGGEQAGEFFTAKFRNESKLGTHPERVFWAWNGNEEGKYQWEAPESQKQYYGNNTALYKMYFTAKMDNEEEEIDKNVALQFAKLALPEINRALFPEQYADEAAEEAAAVTEPAPAATETAAPAADADSDAAAPAEAPAAAN
jgi:hypothetical protein